MRCRYFPEVQAGTGLEGPSRLNEARKMNQFVKINQEKVGIGSSISAWILLELLY